MVPDFLSSRPRNDVVRSSDSHLDKAGFHFMLPMSFPFDSLLLVIINYKRYRAPASAGGAEHTNRSWHVVDTWGLWSRE